MSSAVGDLDVKLKCTVCLSIYRKPIHLACGHNLCCRCLDRLKGGRDCYSCSECLATFASCLTLQRNLKLANIAEHFHTSRKSSPSSDAEQKYLVSRNGCDPNPPDEVLPVGAVCTEHREPWEYFCRQHKVCLCRSCLEGHRTHSWQPLEKAAADGQAVLAKEAGRLEQAQVLLQDMVDWLQNAQAQLRADWARLREQVLGLFNCIREMLATEERRILDFIEAEQSIQDSRMEERVSETDGKRNVSSRLIAEARELGRHGMPDWKFVTTYQDTLERLLKADVHIQSVTVQKRELDRASLNHMGKEHQVLVKKFGKMIRDKISQSRELLVKWDPPTQALRQKVPTVPSSTVVQTPRLTLDPNTAHCNLSLSSDLRSAEWVEQRQSCPTHPERFRLHPQVLCSQGFTSGQHCWEVTLTGTHRWEVGATCKRRDHSWVDACIAWALRWDGRRLQAFEGYTRHLNPLLGSMQQPPGRIRICLDCESGTLSFFTTMDESTLGKDARTLLHTFHIKAQGPIFPGFYLEQSKAPWPMRLKVLLDTLGVRHSILRLVPSYISLPMCVTCYWLSHCTPRPKLLHLQALLLGVVYGALDRLTGCQRGCPEVQAVRERLDSIRVTWEENGPDPTVTHLYNQWQSCMKNSFELNQLLYCPLPKPTCSQLYSGTLVHGLARKLRQGQTPESVLLGPPLAKKLYRDLQEAVLNSVGPDVFSKKVAHRAGRWQDKERPRKSHRHEMQDLSERFLALFCKDMEREEKQKEVEDHNDCGLFLNPRDHHIRVRHRTAQFRYHDRGRKQDGAYLE